MIADSSVLILHARAGLLDELRAWARRIDVPPAVRRETVEAAPDRADARLLAAPLLSGWLRVESPRPKEVRAVLDRHPTLGRGEGETIALALRKRTSRVLTDDGQARRAARLEGLSPLGSLGVVASLHAAGILVRRQDAAGAVRRLLEAGLWVSPAVIETFWERLGGRP